MPTLRDELNRVHEYYVKLSFNNPDSIEGKPHMDYEKIGNDNLERLREVESQIPKEELDKPITDEQSKEIRRNLSGIA